MDSSLVWLAWNGDSANTRVKKAFLRNEPEEAARQVYALTQGNRVFEGFAITNNGSIVESGGDKGMILVPAATLGDLDAIMQQYEAGTECTVSIGIGADSKQCMQALLVAKKRGGDQATIWDDGTQDEMNREDPEDNPDDVVKAELTKDEQPMTAVPPQPDTSDGANGSPAEPMFSPADPAPGISIDMIQGAVIPSLGDAVPLNVASEPVSHVEPTLQDRLRGLSQDCQRTAANKLTVDQGEGDKARARLAEVLGRLAAQPEALGAMVQASPGMADVLRDLIAAVRESAAVMPHGALYADPGESTSNSTNEPLQKASEKGRIHVQHPTGTVIEPGGPNTGRIKVQHDSAMGSPEKVGWVSARSGQIRSNDASGHPVSAKHPLEPGRDEPTVG